MIVLFAGGLLAAVQLQFGVTEIHRTNLDRHFPLAMAPASPDDWPAVRGPQGNGETSRESFPRAIGPSSQWNWQADVPGIPFGGPCIRADLVVVPVVDAASASISLSAFDAKEGRPLWNSKVHDEVPLDPALVRGTVTPACDGQTFFLGSAVSGRLLVTAVDFQGRLRWTTDTGPLHGPNGRLLSPVLHEELVIVAAEQRGLRALGWPATSHLTALHRQTGEVIWRIRRPNHNSAITPALAEVSGRTQLILAAPGNITAYDPSSGELLWSCRWDAAKVADSVAWDQRHVFVAAREPKAEVLAIRADGAGDVTATHVLWRGSAAHISSLTTIRSADSVCLLNDLGLLTSLDRSTGKVQWKRQLTGEFVASPLIAGGELLCVNTQGAGFVVDVTQRGKMIAELSIGTGVIAHPAGPGRQLVFRTRNGVLSLPWDSQDAPVVNSPDPAAKRL